MSAVAEELTTDHVPVREILGRVSSELRRSTAAIERLEETIGDLLFDRERRQSELQTDLQNIDLVRQEIAGLADFVAQLGVDIDGHALVDIAPACTAVTLRALVCRLRSSSSEDFGPADPADGHEWFHI